MKTRTIIAVIALAVVIGSLPFLVGDETSADPSYDTKEITVKSLNEDAPESVEVRFYQDTPHLPYYNLSGLFNIHSGKVMTVTVDGTSYTYTNPFNGATGVFNTETGILHVEDWESFVQVADEEDVTQPYIQIQQTYVVKQGGPVELSLKDYNIAYYPDTNEVWIPLTSAQDLLTSTFAYYTLYLFYSIFDVDADSLSDEDFLKSYAIDLKSYYLGDLRDDDVAAYEYKHLCFVIDNLFGAPDVSALGKELQSAKFDDVLGSHSDATRKIRDWLQSTDVVSYVAGVALLGDYLYDGGHTAFSLFDLLGKLKSADFRKAVEEKIASVEHPEPPGKSEIKKELQAARASIWGEGGEYDNYYEKGDTAVFTFDSFNVDIDAWKAYYKDGGELPDDTYGNLIKALERAKTNPDIRNFVIDLTTNGGGQSDVALSIITMITSDYSHLNVVNLLTGQIASDEYWSDTNLDGKIDEKDLEKQYDFRYAILTTRCSFSCGNLLPIYAQEKGVMIIGENSGGGSRQIEMTGTDGGLQTLSSYHSMTNSRWESVDGGATPDKILIDTSVQDPDYTKLYDIDAISAQMNEFYADPGIPYLQIAAAAIVSALLAVVAAVSVGRVPKKE